MKSLVRVATIVAACVCAAIITTTTAAQDDATSSVRTQAIVEALVEAVQSNYIFPETADAMAARITERLEAGEYDGMDEGALARELTNDLREVSGDLHLRLIVDAGTFDFIRRRDAGEEVQPRENIERMIRSRNFGYTEAKILDGNIGYLRIDNFFWQEGVEDVVAAVMTFLSRSNAVMVDLRTNGGGDPLAEQLFCSYFFPAEPSVHLNSIYDRTADATTEYWTLTELPGPRLADKPVVVLTSRRTFSAAEAAAYDLQSLGRATVVGETTGGGAHPTKGVNLEDNFVVVMPTSRAINAVTGTNWEGVGVVPQAPTEADRTYDVGYLTALEKAVAQAPDWQREDLAWTLDSKRAELDPTPTDPATLRGLVGAFGSHEIELRGDDLWYRDTSEGELWFGLAAIGPDTFMSPDENWFRLEFARGDDGAAIRIRVVYSWGEAVEADRTP